MIVICEECGKKYRIDPDKIKGAQASFDCKACRHRITVRKPEEESPPLPAAPEPPAAEPESPDRETASPPPPSPSSPAPSIGSLPATSGSAGTSSRTIGAPDTIRSRSSCPRSPTLLP